MKFSHRTLNIFTGKRSPLVWSACLHSTTECYKRWTKIFKVHRRLEHARVCFFFLDSAVQFRMLLACQQEQDIPILKRMINASYRVILYYIVQQATKWNARRSRCALHISFESWHVSFWLRIPLRHHFSQNKTNYKQLFCVTEWYLSTGLVSGPKAVTRLVVWQPSVRTLIHPACT